MESAVSYTASENDATIRLNGQSLDVAAEKLARLRELMPEAFAEGKLDVDKLRLVLGEDVYVGEERYGLNWPGKADAYKEIQKRTTATLVPDREGSVDFDTAANVFIEGENLEVLRVLQRSYFGKAALVYIDPPYNSENDSFVYPDDYTERRTDFEKRTGVVDEVGYLNKDDLWATNSKTSARYHSVWLSMMLPRLHLGRNLLREDGAMVIHIDENEHDNLKMVVDELFGQENVLGTVIWNKGNPKGDAKGIASQHEYLIVCAKNKQAFLQSNPLQRKKKNAARIVAKAQRLFSEHDKDAAEATIALRHWLKKQTGFSGGELAYNTVDSVGDAYRLVSMAWPNKQDAPEDYREVLIHPVTKKPCTMPGRGWRYPSATLKSMLKAGQIIFGKDEQTQPQRKYLMRENMTENLPSILFFGGSDDKLLSEMGITFENPKPVAFAKELLDIFTRPNEHDLVVDFFAGSGTTAHALSELNNSDKGNRRYLLVQARRAEDNGAGAKLTKPVSDICAKRLRAVATQMTNRPDDAALFAQPKGLFGFRKFSLGSSSFHKWQDELVGKAQIGRQLELLEASRVGDNTLASLFELFLAVGLPLNTAFIQPDLTKHLYFVKSISKAFIVNDFTYYTLDTLKSLEVQGVVCIDEVFSNDDQLKTNLTLQLHDLGISITIL